MDQSALKFIDDRQAVLRDAYNSYKLQFASPIALLASSHGYSNGLRSLPGGWKIWAWDRWDDSDVDEIITDCLRNESNLCGTPDATGLSNIHKDSIKNWIKDFLRDTGSMFRLYRKGGFDVDDALVALRDTLTFRIQHRHQLLWSPVPYESPSELSNLSKEASLLLGSNGSRRSPASSRTTAQSPRASPFPEMGISTGPMRANPVVKKKGFAGSMDTLIQLYPHSSMDPNLRPIVVVSLKYLDKSTISLTPEAALKLPVDASVPPKTRALAAFERLRFYLAESASKLDESRPLDPLQFILIIDLAGGRVSATAWDMVKWLVRDAADQFHGMCSSVFVVNYSWEFGAIWSFIKHVLPAPAKARVIFPKMEELLEYLGRDTLPPSLGGLCTSTLPYYLSPLPSEPPLSLALNIPPAPSNRSPMTNGKSTSVPHITPTKPTQSRRTSLKHLRSTSHENPYYGYPATIEEGVDKHGRPVRIQHSRRRKRDLAKTLMWLLLLRCRERIAYLPWQLRNLSQNLIRGKWDTLFILIVITVVMSVRGTQVWRRLQNGLRLRPSRRLT